MEHRKLLNQELHRLTPDEYRRADKTPVVLVLDNIRSLNNIGSIFRTADAFRLQALYLCGITATPPHREIHKTALGAEETVPWHHYPDTLDALRHLRTLGYHLHAVEQAEGSIPLPAFRLPADRPSAFILGNEIRGVQQQAIDLCDTCLEIPQLGTKHSLNVAVTAGIILWQSLSPLLPH